MKYWRVYLLLIAMALLLGEPAFAVEPTTVAFAGVSLTIIGIMCLIFGGLSAAVIAGAFN